jgi:Fur family peroxide stress response transcriptional regulator
MARNIPTVNATLKQHGYSTTKTRQAVFGALIDSGPLTMAQLVNKVHSVADRTSVYRTVGLFEKLGIINRLQIGWKYKLELSDLFTDHHHHATCLQCGTVLSLDENPQLEAKINNLAKSVGFHPTNHSLEIRGLCQDCSAG